MARASTPDMIFLRVELPGASGFSVCNKLRRNADTKDIPRIMYASEVTDDVFAQHSKLKTRADEYLQWVQWQRQHGIGRRHTGETIMDATRLFARTGMHVYGAQQETGNQEKAIEQGNHGACWRQPGYRVCGKQ